MREQERDYYLAHDPDKRLAENMAAMFDKKDARIRDFMSSQAELMEQYHALMSKGDVERAKQILIEVRSALDAVDEIDQEKKNLYVEMFKLSPNASEKERLAMDMLEETAKKLTRDSMRKKIE